MALQRAEIPLAITRSTGTVSGSSVPVAVSGASVSVNVRGGGPANVYPTETSNTPGPNPLTTGVDGRIDGWLDEGSYDLLISGSGITSYTQPIEIVSGKSIVNIPGDRLVAGSVGNSALASNAVTNIKIADGQISPLKLTNSVLPLGTVISWWRPSNTYAPPGQSAGQLPAGFVLCDGSTYSSGTHDFGAISITVPNLINRFILGANPAATYASAGDGASVGAGVMGTGGANFINLQHQHLINDHYHIAQGAMGAFSGNMATDDHLHSAGSLYVPNHGHHFEVYSSGSVNFNGSRATGQYTGVSDSHQHFVGGDTWGTGNFGVGGTVGASDRILYTRGNTSGVSDRNTDLRLSSAQDNRPAWTGLVYLIKIKAI